MLALLLGGGVVYLALGDLKEALILLAFATMSVVITVVQETRTAEIFRPREASGGKMPENFQDLLLLPFTSLGRYFGFEPPPAKFFAILAILVVAYLGIVEAAKRVFYAHFATTSK